MSGRYYRSAIFFLRYFRNVSSGFSCCLPVFNSLVVAFSIKVVLTDVECPGTVIIFTNVRKLSNNASPATMFTLFLGWKGSLTEIKWQESNWARNQLTTADKSQLNNLLDLNFLEHGEVKERCHWRRCKTYGENCSQEKSTYEKSKNHWCMIASSCLP